MKYDSLSSLVNVWEVGTNNFKHKSSSVFAGENIHILFVLVAMKNEHRRMEINLGNNFKNA